jgi:hypothetical protein
MLKTIANSDTYVKGIVTLIWPFGTPMVDLLHVKAPISADLEGRNFISLQ